MINAIIRRPQEQRYTLALHSSPFICARVLAAQKASRADLSVNSATQIADEYTNPDRSPSRIWVPTISALRIVWMSANLRNINPETDK